MKRALLFGFLFCIACTASAQKTYTIAGTFKCAYDGELYLMHGGEKDSTTVKNGTFSFNGKAGLPELSYLYFKSKTAVTLDFYYSADGDVLVDLDTLTKTGASKRGNFVDRGIQLTF